MTNENNKEIEAEDTLDILESLLEEVFEEIDFDDVPDVIEEDTDEE